MALKRKPIMKIFMVASQSGKQVSIYRASYSRQQ